jgi:DNA-binding transcriptional LysR family regulator
MEVRQLQIFRTLAEELNFTRTAEKVHTVQSNVTAQIKALEEELGGPLFRPSGPPRHADRRRPQLPALRRAGPGRHGAGTARRPIRRRTKRAAACRRSGEHARLSPAAGAAHLPPPLSLTSSSSSALSTTRCSRIMLETGKLDMAVCMIEDDPQFGSHEVLSAKGSTFLVCCICFLFLAATSQANNTAEAQQKSGFVRLDRVTASRATQWNRNPLRRGHDADHRAARRCAARARGPGGQLPEDASWAVLAAVAHRAVAGDAGVERHTRWASRPPSCASPSSKDPLGADRHRPGRPRHQPRIFPGRPIEYHGAAFRVFRKSPADEHYFGLGDKPGPLDRRNEAFVDWNTDAFGWQESTDPIYKSIPFFITFRKGIAAGIFLDNTWRASFDFNKEYRDGYSFGSEGGPLDYYILYGPDPKAVVKTWAWLVGTTPLPPLWSLGYQQSRYSYYPEAKCAASPPLRSERIPADVIWLDIDYQLKNRPFTVDPERFPHFDQMIQDLKAEHLHTVVITDLHIADLPNAATNPTTKARPATTSSRIPTAQPTWAWSGRARPSFPTSRRRPRATGGARSTDFVKQRRCRLLERHERAGHLRGRLEDHARRRAAPHRRAGIRDPHRQPSGDSQRLRHAEQPRHL